jgi:hypothetical protein
MSGDHRSWTTGGIPDDAYAAIARELPASRLWSLLLEVVEARAAARRTASLVEQWERDRFVELAAVDQRAQLEVDRELLAAASAFQSIELSPVAPLGVCSAMGRTSQNKVLSALRGTEVVADPTNVMALECARRLRRDPQGIVRLATSHRCVRTQELPKVPGFTAHFRIFCLAAAGHERGNHAFVIDAIAEQIAVMLDAMDRLEQHGFAFPDRRVTVLATPAKAALGDRIAEYVGRAPVGRAVLDHQYYEGLRFQIAARSADGVEIPLIDGGTFDWVARLASNDKAVFVATGLGSQLISLLFRQSSSHPSLA